MQPTLILSYSEQENKINRLEKFFSKILSVLPNLRLFIFLNSENLLHFKIGK